MAGSKKKQDDQGRAEEAPKQEKATAAADTKPRRAPRRKPQPRRPMPRWKVILHNDDVNEMGYVVATIEMLTPLSSDQAVRQMFEAHRSGAALLLTTHRERAELYREQFASRKLTVTLEPDQA